MLSAGPRLAARFNFATIRDVAFSEQVDILVIDLAHMLVAKMAYFAARDTITAWTVAPFAARGCSFISSLHRLCSFFRKEGYPLSLQESRHCLSDLPGNPL